MVLVVALETSCCMETASCRDEILGCKAQPVVEHFYRRGLAVLEVEAELNGGAGQGGRSRWSKSEAEIRST